MQWSGRVFSLVSSAQSRISAAWRCAFSLKRNSYGLVGSVAEKVVGSCISETKCGQVPPTFTVTSQNFHTTKKKF